MEQNTNNNQFGSQTEFNNNPYNDQQTNPYGSQQTAYQNSYTPQQPQPNYQNQPVGNQLDYTPISMWGYFGYELLFSIPLVGFILLIVFSFGGTNNVNVRNFARSYFCLIIVLAVVFVFLALAFGLTGLTDGFLSRY